jgi:hypothetical protein
MGIHTHKMELGTSYIIKVKTKNFRPMVQIRDENLQTSYYSNNSGNTANGIDWFQQFSYTPSQTQNYKVVIFQSFPVVNNNNGPLEYTIEIKNNKPLAVVKGELKSTDPHYPMRTGCYFKVHNLDLKAGIPYQIEVIGDFVPFVYLEDALGNYQTMATYNNNTQKLSRLVFNPGKSDTFRVIVTSATGNITGPYTVTVSESPTPVGPGGVGFGGGVIINPPPIPVPAPPFNPVPLPNPIKPGLKKPLLQPVPGVIQPALPMLPVAPLPGNIKFQPGKIQLPADFKLPPNVQLPPGIQIQPNGVIEIDPAILPGLPAPKKN